MRKTLMIFLVALLAFVLVFPSITFGKITLPNVEVVVGTIKEVRPSSILINGREVYIDSETVIRLNGSNVNLSLLKVGSYAVAICEKSSNKLTAKVVQVYDITPKVLPRVIKGTVTAISPNSIVVNNTTILVSGDTVVRFRGKLVPFSELKVGDNVAVFCDYSNNIYTAKEIVIILHKEYELRTTITQIGPDFMIVKDFQYPIFVDSKTSITGIGRGKINFSDLKVGDPVQVHVRADNDRYIATSIVLLSFKQKASVVVSGTVSFIDLESKTFRLSELPFITFKFSSNYKGKVNIADLKVNDRVMIYGQYLDVSTIEVSNLILLKVKRPKPIH
ncbi:MAG: hypothetical protein KBG04_05265 [Bacteroidales bacterium]|nr:hypothetical protein [Bacteroidales bacterium]